MNWVERMRQLIAGVDTNRDRPIAGVPDSAALDTRTIDDAFSRGVEAYNIGAYDVALLNFETVIAARHDDADAHNRLGLVHFRQQHLEDADDCFVLATHFRPGFAAAWYNLALVA